MQSGNNNSNAILAERLTFSNFNKDNNFEAIQID